MLSSNLNQSPTNKPSATRSRLAILSLLALSAAACDQESGEEYVYEPYEPKPRKIAVVDPGCMQERITKCRADDNNHHAPISERCIIQSIRSCTTTVSVTRAQPKQ